VESLDNQASVWRGYLNIMLFLRESVWLSFFFWTRKWFRGQQNKESGAGHSLFQRKMIPVGKRGIKTSPLFQCFYFVPVVFHIVLRLNGMHALSLLTCVSVCVRDISHHVFRALVKIILFICKRNTPTHTHTHTH